MRIVQYSTGLGSAEVARREYEEHGPDGVLLLTADTRCEDPDNWRFAHEVVDRLMTGVEWLILSKRRTPMQIGREQRIVPNDRMAICSRELKRRLLRRWIDDNCDPARDTIVLGFDWTEEHRLTDAKPHWTPFECDAPLTRPPYIEKGSLSDEYRARGIEPPRLYAAGFSHANCYGACVRGGQKAWARLLRTNPTVYRQWEGEEEETRRHLGKNVSILRDRRGGTSKPLSLQTFRLRLTANSSDHDGDEGACGCFSETET